MEMASKGARSLGDSSASGSTSRKFKPSKFLAHVLGTPKVIVKDLKPLLNGRISIRVSEVIEYENRKNGKVKSSSTKPKLPPTASKRRRKVGVKTLTERPNKSSAREPLSSSLLKLPKPTKVQHNFYPPSLTVDVRMTINRVPHMQRQPEQKFEIGRFYLQSQEGNRLQLMKFNGSSFEPYNWKSASQENNVTTA